MGEDEDIDTSARRFAPGTVQCQRCYHRVAARKDGHPVKHQRKKPGSVEFEDCPGGEVRFDERQEQ